MGTDSVEVVVTRRVSEAAWWAGLSKALERVVGNLPTYRDTVRGRRNANQVRLVILATGVLVVVLWRSPWAPTALILCASALFLPISESRRRHLCATLRTRRMITRLVSAPGKLEVDDTHVTLTCEGETLRRFRRKVTKLRQTKDAMELRAGKKKVERLVVVEGSAEPSEDLWLVGDRAVIEQLLR